MRGSFGLPTHRVLPPIRHSRRLRLLVIRTVGALAALPQDASRTVRRAGGPAWQLAAGRTRSRLRTDAPEPIVSTTFFRRGRARAARALARRYFARAKLATHGCRCIGAPARGISRRRILVAAHMLKDPTPQPPPHRRRRVRTRASSAAHGGVERLVLDSRVAPWTASCQLFARDAGAPGGPYHARCKRRRKSGAVRALFYPRHRGAAGPVCPSSLRTVDYEP